VLRGAVLAVGRALGWALVGMLLLGLVLYIRYLRSGPELEPWHRAHLDEEFTAARADEVRTIADYRALERRLFDEIDREIYAETEPEDRLPFNRYFRGSQSDPATWPVDWNRTWEHSPASPPAAVLLLHGLTDSPYSLSHVALPFPPDDPLYGYAAPQDRTHVQLGRLEARGENGVLAIPTWMLTRLRSNPFYPYLAERVWAFVNDRTPAPDAAPPPPPQAP
jgi:hypothetical protein